MPTFMFYRVEESDNTTHTKIRDNIIIIGAWNTRESNTFGRQTNCNAGRVLQIYPNDFLIEVTMFTPTDAQAGYLETFGFRSVYSVASLVGKRWTFNNGSYIVFSSGRMDMYTANDNYCFALNLSGKNASFWSYSPATSIPNQTYIKQEFPAFNSNGTVDIAGGAYLLIGGFSGNGGAFWDGVTPEQLSTDPYTPGGESDTGGGTGNFDGTGDNIDIPSLPTLSAVDTGFITLFNPSAGELRSLANYMWNNSLFDLDAWKKIFANPMDAILGLSIVPVAVPNGGQSTVTVGNISTGVSMNKAATQYVAVDCGTLNVNEYWGAYLDYDPYTKAEIYLPYIGTHPLAVDDIMGKAVHVVYHVDVLSGACCAFVKCGSSVLYTFVGQCAASIPITGNDWTNVINGVMSIAASIGTMVATGGASAPLAATSIASAAVNSMKPNVEKSGSLGGMGGMLGVQTPYLILTRPRQALPANQNTLSGYPSYITRKLSDISGYTEIDSIHLKNIPASEQEISEIESLLKSGVIL